MKVVDALRALAEVTAYQWGMVTAAQAGALGVSRLDLSRLAEAGHLTRLAHGVYLDSGSPGDQFDDLRAAWLSTDPTRLGGQRIKDRATGVVVAGTSAARLHDIGSLWATRHEFVYPGRRQSQRAELRYRQRALDPRDVTLVAGLPTLTLERTLADLVEDVGDLSLVGDALRDAARKRDLDLTHLRDLLAPLAARHGFDKGDGAALLDRLMDIAGIGPDAVARRVAADPSMGARVAADYLATLSPAEREQLVAAIPAPATAGDGSR
jgi:predicted transcriptional regulator of viral defense system